MVSRSGLLLVPLLKVFMIGFLGLLVLKSIFSLDKYRNIEPDPESPPILDPRPRDKRASFDHPISESPRNEVLVLFRQKTLAPVYAIYTMEPLSSEDSISQANDRFWEAPSIQDYGLTDFNYTHAASVCVNAYSNDTESYMKLTNTTIRIIWMVWLPSNSHGRNIVLGQLYHLMAPHGLLYRPNTMLYITLLTDSHAEERWFYNLDIIRRPFFPLKIFQTSDNAFEFWAIRWLWELACAHPDDIYLYFHTKGASYAYAAPQYTGKRNRAEMVLSRQNLRPWRSILSLFASSQQPTISWTGGKQMNWFNFFWIRGQYVSTLMKPVRTNDRFWYEKWNGRLSKAKQCDGSYDLERAVTEGFVDTSKEPFGENPTSLWSWYPGNFYATKECKEHDGDQGYMVNSILDPIWTPPSCKPIMRHDFCNNQEH